MNVVVKNQNRGTGRVQKPSEIVMKTKDLTCQGVPEKTHFQNATERPRVKNPPVVIMIRISECARGSVRPFLSRGRSVAF